MSAPHRLFAALGDERRLELVERIANDGPISISDLADELPVSRQAVRKHLDILHDAGIVRGTRVGRAHYWRVDERGIQLAERAMDELAGRWRSRLARLKMHVERRERD